MYDLSDFKLSDMIRCGIAIRGLGAKAHSMEEVAGELVRYFFDAFVDRQTGRREWAMVRFFKTHDFDKLPAALQNFAVRVLREKPVSSSFKCLTLLGTTGEEEAWRSREKSQGHQAIPLPSREVFSRIPMMRNLIKQMGLEVETVINPDPELLLDLSKKTFNIFYVPTAEGSPYIPVQENFVKPYGIKSVLGFGGGLPSGNVFTVIMFSTVPVSAAAAGLFNTLALNVKVAILPFADAVFTAPDR